MTSISYTGKIIRGKGLGGRLGFPTINLTLEDAKETGVFAGFVYLEGKKMPAAIHIGSILEAHILDWHGEVYGRAAEVVLVKKIRESKKFSNFEELKKWILEDVALVKKILSLGG